MTAGNETVSSERTDDTRTVVSDSSNVGILSNWRWVTIKGDYFYTDFNGSEFYPPGIILCKIELARKEKSLFAGRAEFENISV